MENIPSFNLDKMETELTPEGKALYRLKAGETVLFMNDLIGLRLKLHFQPEINCIHCQKKTAKSYSGGYCYSCFITLPECDMCILRPETCHYARGTCRDPEWGLKNCMAPHYVYLANSSGVKVGITRASQIPTRWIDQGAIQALPILKVSSRYQSGVFEKLFAEEITDRTDWRGMLRGGQEKIDLISRRDELFHLFGEDLDRFEEEFGGEAVSILEDERIVDIDYPVKAYPDKVTSFSPGKTPVVEGELMGIKGQYLIFDKGVINIRSYAGYRVQIEF